MIFSVRGPMVNNLATVRKDAYSKVERIRHLVSLREIANLDPAKGVAENLVDFVLEKLPVELMESGRNALLAEAKEFLLDIDLPGYTDENTIANLLSLLSSKVEFPCENKVNEQPQEDHSLGGTNVMESNEVCLHYLQYSFAKLLKPRTGKDPSLCNSLDR